MIFVIHFIIVWYPSKTPEKQKINNMSSIIRISDLERTSSYLFFSKLTLYSCILCCDIQHVQEHCILNKYKTLRKEKKTFLWNLIHVPRFIVTNKKLKKLAIHKLLGWKCIAKASWNLCIFTHRKFRNCKFENLIAS